MRKCHKPQGTTWKPSPSGWVGFKRPTAVLCPLTLAQENLPWFCFIVPLFEPPSPQNTVTQAGKSSLIWPHLSSHFLSPQLAVRLASSSTLPGRRPRSAASVGFYQRLCAQLRRRNRKSKGRCRHWERWASRRRPATFRWSYGRIPPRGSHCRARNRPGNWTASQQPAPRLASASGSALAAGRERFAPNASNKRWWPPWGWKRGGGTVPAALEAPRAAALGWSCQQTGRLLASRDELVGKCWTMITTLQCPQDKSRMATAAITPNTGRRCSLYCTGKATLR